MNHEQAGAVYVQTNDADDNEVVAYRRSGDGALHPLGSYGTGRRAPRPGAREPRTTGARPSRRPHSSRWGLRSRTGGRSRRGHWRSYKLPIESIAFEVSAADLPPHAAVGEEQRAAARTH